MNLSKQVEIAAVVLAAGKGKRMGDGPPKVLRLFHGKPIIHWVLDHLKELTVEDQVLVLGEDLSPFKETLRAYPDLFLCQQLKANGTGSAAAVTADFFSEPKPHFAEGGKAFGYEDKQSRATHLLILTADSPLIRPKLLREFISDSLKKESDLSVLGAKLDKPFGYGRLIFAQDKSLEAIVEEKDLAPEQKKLQSCNSGVIFVKKKLLFSLLSAIDCQNKQSEYYLTDCIKEAKKRGLRLFAYMSQDPLILRGINTPHELNELEKSFSPLS